MNTELRPQPHWALADWLRYQESLHPRAIELGLSRVRSVAQRLGVLERPPLTLTVGGTNGKGSSATLATLICREAGHRVGLYTSPHLLRYNERVQLDGREASDAELCDAFLEIERARDATPLTYFEFGTLAALLRFRHAGVGVQVLEVGLGGRLDAVNIVDADAALVTNIGLDHQDWLGAGRESIGREKAGIFRAGRPSVSADPQPPRSLSGATLQLGRDFFFEDHGAHWSWRGGTGAFAALPPPGLAGRFQQQNAAGVLAMLLSLPELGVTEAHIRAALPRLALPGRFQRAGRIIADVAHNAEAAEALVQTLQESGIRDDVSVVLGMLADKPAEAFGRELARVCRRAYVASLPPPRGLDAATLAGRLENTGLQTQICASLTQALHRACAESRGPVLITGSFLTVAELTSALYG